MKSHRLFNPFVAVFALAVLSAQPVLAADEVNLYSARKEALIKPLLDRFTEQTGIRVNLVTGKADALLQRLKSEGRNSPADLLLTVDAGRLYRAKMADLLGVVQSDSLNKAIPAAYRDPQGYWYGLSLRARTLVAGLNREGVNTLSGYDDLSSAYWKGKVCVRSSNNIYNQSLVAAMIATHGVKATETWASGLVRNMARPPQGGDRDQIKAVAAGQCDVALVNSYYLAQMIHSSKPAQREAADKVQLLWADQNKRGVHINISGMGITRAAKNRDNAIRLMEFLVSDTAQQWYAKTNFEFPIRSGIAVGETLQAWGSYIADPVNMAALGEYNGAAVRLMDRVGWK